MHVLFRRHLPGFSVFNALWRIKSCCLGSKIDSYKVTCDFSPHMLGFNFIRNKNQSFVHQEKKEKWKARKKWSFCVGLSRRHLLYTCHLNTFSFYPCEYLYNCIFLYSENTDSISTPECNCRNHHFYIFGSRLATCFMNNPKRFYFFSEGTTDVLQG